MNTVSSILTVLICTANAAHSLPATAPASPEPGVAIHAELVKRNARQLPELTPVTEAMASAGKPRLCDRSLPENAPPIRKLRRWLRCNLGITLGTLLALLGIRSWRLGRRS